MKDKVIVGTSGNLVDHELEDVRQRVAFHLGTDPANVLVLPNVVAVSVLDDGGVPPGLDDLERDQLASPLTSGTRRHQLRQKVLDTAKAAEEDRAKPKAK